MTTSASEVDYYTTEGHDREVAHAILSQSRLPHASRIDDIQVQHLLRIGYRAGRQVTEPDTSFATTDRRLIRLLTLLAGAMLGVALSVFVVWVTR